MPPLPTILTTARLTLTLADPTSDADCLSLLNLYIGNGLPPDTPIGWIRRKHLDRAVGSEWITEQAPSINNAMFFLIRLTPQNPSDQQGEVIGFIGFSKRPAWPCPDMGYMIMPLHQGQGYASESAGEVLKFWTETVGVKEVMAWVRCENVASRRVLGKIGMVLHEGEVNGREADETLRKAVVFLLPGQVWKGQGEITLQ